MDIYHSFYFNKLRINDLNEDILKMYSLSALLALKNYGNCHLVTNKEGANFLSSIPYTSIKIFDESFDDDYAQCIWSYSKIKAFEIAVNKNKPFLHIDHDLFLFKKLPEYIEKKEIVVLHKELETSKPGYMYDDIEKLYYNDFLKYISFKKEAYNTAVFGGTNLTLIKKYINNVLSFLKDEHLSKDLWLNKNSKIDFLAKAVLTEQWSLYNSVNKSAVYWILDLEKDINAQTKDLGITHLWGSKEDKNIIEKVYKLEDKERKKLEFENSKKLLYDELFKNYSEQAKTIVKNILQNVFNKNLLISELYEKNLFLISLGHHALVFKKKNSDKVLRISYIDKEKINIKNPETYKHKNICSPNFHINILDIFQVSEFNYLEKIPYEIYVKLQKHFPKDGVESLNQKNYNKLKFIINEENIDKTLLKVCQDLMEGFEYLTSNNIPIMDFHIENVLYNSKTKQYQIIDWYN